MIAGVWILRDNYGNPAYEPADSALYKDHSISVTYHVRKFPTKAEAEAYLVLRIVEGHWDEGVWHAEESR